MIEFDLNGRKTALDETVFPNVRVKALAYAGSSTILNDLAVILGRALKWTGSGPTALVGPSCRGGVRCCSCLAPTLAPPF